MMEKVIDNCLSAFNNWRTGQPSINDKFPLKMPQKTRCI